MMLPGLMSRCSTPRRVGVVDRVADVGEPPQQLAQLQRPPAGVGLQRRVGVEAVDGLLEAVAADEPHGVVGPAVGVGAQAVDRDDPRVLQPAGDLGLEQEAGAADRVVGVLVEDLLERHLAVQLGVQGDEDGAQAAPGVGPEDAEPLAVGGGRADGVAGGAVGVGVGRTAEPSWARVCSISGSPSAARLSRVERPAGMAARLFSASPPCFFRCRPTSASTAARCVGVEVAAGDEVVGQRPGLVAGPGLEGGDELVLVDQAVLQGEQAEEQVAVGGDGGHGASLPGGRHGRCAVGPRRRGPRPGRAGSAGLSHNGSAHSAPRRLIGPPAPRRLIGPPRVRRPRGPDRMPMRLLAPKPHF